MNPAITTITTLNSHTHFFVLNNTNCYNAVARRKRRNHSPAFKAQVAVAALKGDTTLPNWRSNLIFIPTSSPTGRVNFWNARAHVFEETKTQGSTYLTRFTVQLNGASFLDYTLTS